MVRLFFMFSFILLVVLHTFPGFTSARYTSAQSRYYYYNYYNYFLTYSSSSNCAPPPPPAYCSVKIEPRSNPNVTKECGTFTTLPTYVDQSSALNTYVNEIDSYIYDYKKLTFNGPGATTTNVNMTFFQSCNNYIVAALCQSFFVNCADLSLTECTDACNAMETCRSNLVSVALATKPNGTTVDYSKVTDCTGHLRCDSNSDSFCCWSTSNVALPSVQRRPFTNTTTSLYLILATLVGAYLFSWA